MPQSKLAIIRADASSTMGIGHIIRMMALAEALLNKRWQVIFYYQDCPAHLLATIEKLGANAAKLPATSGQMAPQANYLADECRRLEASLLVLDGYQFDEQYQQIVSQCGAITLAMDDYQHCLRYHTDIIVNQNPGTGDWHYDCSRDQARLLLGLDYVLLRSQFINTKRPAMPGPFKIVITLGGGDAANVSAKILTAAAQAIEGLSGREKGDYQLTLVCGAANSHIQSLQSQVELLQKQANAHCQYELLKSVDDMATLLASARLVISAGGGTVWEAACLGVANMVLILADNQKNVAKFAEQGAVVNLGKVTELDYQRLPEKICAFVGSEELHTMPARARSLVDGQGAARVVEVVENFRQ